MYAPQTYLKGVVAQLLPQAKQDLLDLDVPLRLGRYGELMGVPGVPQTKNNLAREGTYWRSGTATLGTGVSYSVRATFSDTVPFMYLANLAWPGDPGAPFVELDYLKIIVTVAAASGTTCQFGAKVDSALRYPTTDNTTGATPTACASQVQVGSRKSVLQVRYQSSSTASAVPAASANAWNAAEASIGGLETVGDELVIEFGKTDISGDVALTAAQATYPGRKVASCPSLVIAPGHCCVFYLWQAGNTLTPLSYSFELGHFER